ncbi:MAG: hypothetical protein ACKOTD_04970, partial [Phycisphaerales bacterium]
MPRTEMNVTRTPAASVVSVAVAVEVLVADEVPPGAPGPDDGFGSAVIAAAGAGMDRGGSAAMAARCAG